MSSLGSAHPAADALFRFADGGSDGSEAKEVRLHIAACWECRSEIDEIARTISACVEYQRSVLHARMPEPPEPWFDLRRAVERDNTATARANEPRFAGWFGPRRWIPAGAIAAAAVVAFFYLQNAPSARAAELLRRAAIAAKSQPDTPRRIRVRTKRATFVRTVRLAHAPARAPEAGSPVELEAAFRSAHYNWDDPLSAAAYSDWRDRLRDKHDQVTIDSQAYRLRTTTTDGEVTEADLTLRRADLRATEARLRFRNNEWVELSEMPNPAPAEIADEGGAASQPVDAGSIPHQTPTEAATPSDELAVFAALHRLGADLGDPVEVTRSGPDVVVSGLGIPPARQHEIRTELEGLPRVSLRFDDPGQTPARKEPSNPERPSVATNRSLQELEQRLGSRAALDGFVDALLDGTEAMMARTHALRRLATRFPPVMEKSLNAADRTTLQRMVAEHMSALANSANELRGLVKPVLPDSGTAPTGQSSATRPWQSAASDLFESSRRADASLVDILNGAGGTASSQDAPGLILGALEHVRSTAERYGRHTTTR